MKIIKKITYTTTNDDTIFTDYFEFKNDTVGKGKKALDFLIDRNLHEIHSIETIKPLKIVKFIEVGKSDVQEIALDAEIYHNGKLVLDYMTTNYDLECIISIEKKMPE